MNIKIVYDADMEEPDCMRCDHCIDDNGYCNKCGPDNFWAYYRRTEKMEVEENEC